MSYFPKPSLNENDLAIIERGDTAAHSIDAGQYVSWRGRTGKAKAAILQGATLSESLFDYEEDGTLNALNASLKISEIINTSLSINASTYEPKTVSFAKNYTLPPTVIGQVTGSFVPQREVGGIIITEITTNGFTFRGYNNYSSRLTISYTFIVIPETP